MLKKVTIILSILLFAILCALIVCEKMNPEAGYELIHKGAVISRILA